MQNNKEDIVSGDLNGHGGTDKMKEQIRNVTYEKRNSQ